MKLRPDVQPVPLRERVRPETEVVERPLGPDDEDGSEARPSKAARDVSEVVRDLERELRAQGQRRWLKRLSWLLVASLVLAGALFWRKLALPAPLPRFKTAKIEQRHIFEQVQSTGSVKPLTEVQVGAQVSGRVVAVRVDFNSVVKKGDLLAEIDPSLFGAQVSQAGAQLQAARASVTRAKARLAALETNLVRTKKLRAAGIGTQAEVDQIQGDRDVAQAEVTAATAQIGQLDAQLSSARTTLAYTRIYSPIDGVVVSRAVDPGQTVAASFSAPVLFLIAQDLKQMQVLADIDEADVGKLREGMKAEVVVDAFPGRKFSGRVSQVRYSPNNVQGVVTYSAVVDVENPELKLRPGMTATVTIRTREAEGVLAVQNAALRFRPLPAHGAEGQPMPVDPLPPLEHGQGRVYVVTGGERGKERIEPRSVGIGISDGVWTEIKTSVLRAGSEVVIDEREDEPNKRGFRIL